MLLIRQTLQLARGLSNRVVAADGIHVGIATFKWKRAPTLSHQTGFRGGLFQAQNTGRLPVDINAEIMQRFPAEKRRSIW
jgi:hypothetical protein